MQWEHFTHGKQNACLPIFEFLQVERATKQRRPLVQLKTKQLMLPARCWKCSVQHSKCIGHGNDSALLMANKIAVCRSLMFTRGEDGEATSPSFQPENAVIGASSSSLEALIATRYIQRGWERVALYP